MQQTAAVRTPVAVARYFDEVVDRLTRAGIDVAQIVLDLTPARPMRGQLVIDRGRVLRWGEDLGWSNGVRTTSPSAHPSEVAGLLENL